MYRQQMTLFPKYQDSRSIYEDPDHIERLPEILIDCTKRIFNKNMMVDILRAQVYPVLDFHEPGGEFICNVRKFLQNKNIPLSIRIKTLHTILDHLRVFVATKPGKMKTKIAKRAILELKFMLSLTK